MEIKTQRWVEQQVQWFIGLCKETGMKVTPQRVAIYRELAATDEHPSAEAIFNKIKTYFPNVSLTTVYRTLETFEGRGVISVVNTLYNAARWDAKTEQHNHLVCVSCKKVEDLYDDTSVNLELDNKKGFRVLGYNLLINGICKECQEMRS
ncbi:MAG: transcriptional repressor [Candidatus Dadabacteria bacterium]|nr:transcriptional repressor [Candidatus Dadabacteria bacterium]